MSVAVLVEERRGLKALAEQFRELEEIAKKHGVSVEELPAVVRRFKSKIEKTMKELWESPEGQVVKDLMSLLAHKTKYAERVREIMKRASRELAQAAEETGIGQAYRRLLGKE